jgi:DNA-binding transcriptional ArsR family regulator
MARKTTSDFTKFPEAQIDLVAGCFRALGDPTRLRILRALKAGEMTVHDLVALFTWTQPNISRHLSILSRAGLVRKTKRGPFVYYSISDPRVFHLCDNVCSHIKQALSAYSLTR